MYLLGAKHAILRESPSVTSSERTFRKICGEGNRQKAATQPKTALNRMRRTEVYRHCIKILENNKYGYTFIPFWQGFNL